MLVTMVKRQPKGNSKGGQFAPGDASRSSAGQVDVGETESDRIEFGGGVVNGGGEWWTSGGRLKQADDRDDKFFVEPVYHRIGGPAVQNYGGVEKGGSEEWWVRGVCDRIGGPAAQWMGGVENGGGEAWMEGGLNHRVDGPAVQRNGGVSRGGTEEYWLEGEQYDTKEAWEAAKLENGYTE